MCRNGRHKGKTRPLNGSVGNNVEYRPTERSRRQEGMPVASVEACGRRGWKNDNLIIVLGRQVAAPHAYVFVFTQTVPLVLPSFPTACAESEARIGVR